MFLRERSYFIEPALRVLLRLSEGEGEHGFEVVAVMVAGNGGGAGVRIDFLFSSDFLGGALCKPGKQSRSAHL